MTECAAAIADGEPTRVMEQDDVTGVENLMRQKNQIINLTNVVVTTNATSLAIRPVTNHRIASTLRYHDAGRTALHDACEKKEFHVIERLLKSSKVHVNSQDVNGRTPLHILLSCNPIYMKTDHQRNLHCINLLLVNNANVNIQDKNGMSSLFCAIERRGKKKLDILRLLLNTNVDVNVQLQRPYHVYIKGDTILHYAVRKKNIEIVNMILEICNPILLATNSNNETAYDIAQRLHHEPIMECLKMTLVLQCHIFLRQKWIRMKPVAFVKNEEKNINDDDETIMIVSRKRQKNDNPMLSKNEIKLLPCVIKYINEVDT